MCDRKCLRHIVTQQCAASHRQSTNTAYIQFKCVFALCKSIDDRTVHHGEREKRQTRQLRDGFRFFFFCKSYRHQPIQQFYIIDMIMGRSINFISYILHCAQV